jgi:two-component system chemotaxis response regulator CheB
MELVSRCNVVVIGTSAGGVDALPRLLGQLPAGFPAVVLIVQHIMAPSTGHLVEILRRGSQMPVSWAEHRDELILGHVFLAPAGIHMQVDRNRVLLVGGARENHSRPSISRLFRSAAAHHGNRTIGVLLTGMLDDGVTGLVAIKQAGGVVVVQDPADAPYPDMPSAALRAVTADHVAPLDAIGAVLIRLTREEIRPASVPAAVEVEAGLDAGSIAPATTIAGLGPQTTIACPDCGGPLWETGDERGRGFRCYLGHAMSATTLLDDKGRELEASLWAAVRALEERASTLSKLARDSERLGHAQSARHYEDRSREAHDQAERARRYLIDLLPSTRPRSEGVA